MIDAKFLDQLARFNLVIHKNVTTNLTGQRKSKALGRGLLFKDRRIYAMGDDFRSVDWKVYARTDDLYIKTFEEEKNLVVHAIVDASASMNFGKSVSKFDYASMLAVGFAYLALKDNEKFQFSTFSDTMDIFQPKKGMSHIASMIEHLNSLKLAKDSKLYDSLLHYKKSIGSRSLIFLISDFLIDLKDIKEAIPLLGKHEVHVIQVLDPVEKELEFSGDFNLKDSETGGTLRTYISPRLRGKYNELIEQHSTSIRQECSVYGFKFYQITTDIPVFDAFYRILR